MSRYEIRRGADRARTRTEWLDSRHSLAFGSHYDPDDTHFGVLLAHNEDLVQPGPGYPAHVHRDVEILTWVLAGSLRHHALGPGGQGSGDQGHGVQGHGDQAAGSTLIHAGQLHHISAGSGIRHTESSARDDQPVRLVQMWLSPDEPGVAPSHRLVKVGDRLAPGELVEVASGLARHEDQGVLRIRQRAAALSIGRLPAGATVTLPAAPYLHVFLAAGSVTVRTAAGGAASGNSGGGDATGRQSLAAGDALRITGGGGERVAAGEPAELLVWRMG